MNCKEYAFLQTQYLDGDLDAATMEEIRAHLKKCPSCRRLHEEAQKLFSVLPQIDDIEIPQGLEMEVLKAVKKGPKREKQGFHIPRFLRAWQFYSVPAACILIYTVLYGLSGANLPAADETLVYTVRPREKIYASLPVLPDEWPLSPQESAKPATEPVTSPKTGRFFSAQLPQENAVSNIDSYDMPIVASSPKILPSQEATPSPEAAASSASTSTKPASVTPAPTKPTSVTPAPSFSIASGRRPQASATEKPNAEATTPTGEKKEDKTQTPAKTYPTVSSLVKRSITFVVDDTEAAAVFQKNQQKGEQAVRNALSRAGFHFTTRESVVEEYASSYNALANDATLLSARIAKGETTLSDLLAEKEWKMQTMREDCATPILRLAYQ